MENNYLRSRPRQGGAGRGGAGPPRESSARQRQCCRARGQHVQESELGTPVALGDEPCGALRGGAVAGRSRAASRGVALFGSLAIAMRGCAAAPRRTARPALARLQQRVCLPPTSARSKVIGRAARHTLRGGQTVRKVHCLICSCPQRPPHCTTVLSVLQGMSPVQCNANPTVAAIWPD